MKLTAALFALFLLLFVTITLVSKHRFSAGEGLADSVKNEAIVQFVLRPDSAAARGIDARPETPALRAPYNTPLVQNLLLKNLSSEAKQILFQVQVEPFELADSVRWSMPWPVRLNFSPGEEKKLPLAFLVDKEKFKTHDGTLTFRILF